MSEVIPVHQGTFSCPHCHRVWIGTWQGDLKDIRCAWCEKPIYEHIVSMKEKEKKRRQSMRENGYTTRDDLYHDKEADDETVPAG